MAAPHLAQLVENLRHSPTDGLRCRIWCMCRRVKTGGCQQLGQPQRQQRQQQWRQSSTVGTCSASSRVGEMTRAPSPSSLLQRRRYSASTTGSRKARVLPALGRHAIGVGNRIRRRVVPGNRQFKWVSISTPFAAMQAPAACVTLRGPRQQLISSHAPQPALAGMRVRQL